MAIVTTTTELKKYFTTDDSFDFDTVLPYIELAEDEVKRVLGKELYEELNTFYQLHDETANIYLNALLPYAQRPVVQFAFLKGLDKFNVSIGNMGIGVIHNTQLAPASEKRVENLRTSILDGAYDSLEYLLEFLEANKDDYPTWEDSDAYAYQYEFLISSARKFDELYKINRSRLTFLNWRPAMADVELLQMAPAVSSELIADIKEQIKADAVLTTTNQILPYLQKALAYLTAAKMDNPKMERDGMHYLMMAKTFMDANNEHFPLYVASNAYNAELLNYQSYENTEDSLFGVFG